jgi:NADH-quinone oxidoreductase subunit J
MELVQILFYFYAAVLVMSAAATVLVRHPVKAALWLVLAFFSAACVWMTLEAEFLAIVLVLVYVGAVMVLFLFVVMMLDINLTRLREGFAEYLPIGGVVAVLMIVEMAVVLSSKALARPNPPPHGANYSNTREIGMLLYTDYVYAFEIAGLILLVAIVAAIVLTLRRRPSLRTPNPSKQIEPERNERLRLVQMPAEARKPIGKE